MVYIAFMVVIRHGSVNVRKSAKNGARKWRRHPPQAAANAADRAVANARAVAASGRDHARVIDAIRIVVIGIVIATNRLHHRHADGRARAIRTAAVIMSGVVRARDLGELSRHTQSL